MADICNSASRDSCLSRAELERVLYFFKNYPSFRVMRAIFGYKTVSSAHDNIWRLVSRLSKALAGLKEQLWQNRNEYPVPSDVARIFGRNVKGIVDTFPIYLHRPRSRAWNRALYQGKYKSTVMKVRLRCPVSTVCMIPVYNHLELRCNSMSCIVGASYCEPYWCPYILGRPTHRRPW